MLVSKHEIKAAIESFDKQLTAQINKDKVNIKLDCRDAVALLGLLQDTIYTNTTIHGWDSKGMRSYIRE